jgi:hypothetical protein
VSTNYRDVVAKHAVPLELGVVWEPNAPLAILVSDDFGKTALALERHPDDPAPFVAEA